jgi:magnesium-transporting ATPase (P-type)
VKQCFCHFVMVVSPVVTISMPAIERANGALRPSRLRPPKPKGAIVSVRIISTWIAVFAVIAIALGTLTVTSQGELPYVQTDQVHTAPAWG